MGHLRRVIYTGTRGLIPLRLPPTFSASCLQLPAGALAAAKSFFLKSKRLSRNRLEAVVSLQHKPHISKI